MLPFDPEFMAYQQKRSYYEALDKGLQQLLYVSMFLTLFLSRGEDRQWVFFAGLAVIAVLFIAWIALYWFLINPLVCQFFRLPVKLDETGKKPENRITSWREQ